MIRCHKLFTHAIRFDNLNDVHRWQLGNYVVDILKQNNTRQTNIFIVHIHKYF